MLGRKYWAETSLSELSAKFSLGEGSTQFPDPDLFLVIKYFSLYEAQFTLPLTALKLRLWEQHQPCRFLVYRSFSLISDH